AAKLPPPSPPERWESTERLQVDVDEAEDALAALSVSQPFALPDPRLAWALIDFAKAWQFDVERLLGLDGDVDVIDAVESDAVGPGELERLFDALGEDEPADVRWDRIRLWWTLQRDIARKLLEHRLRQEDRLRMMAALPRGDLLERVIR